MDISTQLRGQMYNTNMAYRCPNFSKCKTCSCCDNYNQHNYMCVTCENSKPKEMRCTHTDEQQAKFVFVMEMFNRPLAHIDDNMNEISSLVETTKEDVIDDLVKMGRSL